MVVAGADYQINKNLLVNTELAMSRFDLNTFSAKDRNDDQGYAGRVKITYDRPLNTSLDHPLTLRLTGSYERVDKNFRPVERLRPVEFTREWGLPIFMQQEEEQITDLSVELMRGTGHSIRHSLQRYERGLLFNGWKYQLHHQLNAKKWSLNSMVNYSSMDSGMNKGFFFRPHVQLKRQLKFLGESEIGGVYYLEHNQISNRETDTLSRSSFHGIPGRFFYAPLISRIGGDLIFLPGEINCLLGKCWKILIAV
jgi:hypothetical protein